MNTPEETANDLFLTCMRMIDLPVPIYDHLLNDKLNKIDIPNDMRMIVYIKCVELYKNNLKIRMN